MNKNIQKEIDDLVFNRFMMSETTFRTKLAIILKIVREEEKEKAVIK